MSLWFDLIAIRPTEVLSVNITHNLGKMANEAGIYNILWRPDENGYKSASDIIDILEKGLNNMKARPEYYKQFDSPNGWGLYEHFIPWLETVLEVCKEYPDAEIRVSR